MPDYTYISQNSTPANNITPVHKQLQSDSCIQHEADAIANKVMRMPDQNFIQRKCEHCEEEERAQRKPLSSFIQKKESANNNVVANNNVSNQINASKGSGNKMNASTKSFMESRFGADFSNVRIHSNNNASQLSNQLNAQAFTIGNDIYFNEGKYSPESFEGKHLLAHELTHTLQQSTSLLRKISCDGNATAPPRAAQTAGHNKIDARAQAIVDIAAGSDSVATKAVNIVTQIICQYYPSQASTVDAIRFDSNLSSGLETQSAGSGATSTGIIKVSSQFVNDSNAAGIARRVLQVGHELQHIQQYRSGLGGSSNKTEREFLAFYEESLADEFEGTGRMQQGTRLNLVDGTIKNYFCLTASLQTKYAIQLANLQTRRKAIIATGKVRNPGAEPTSC